jgi:hypothetical protein
MLTPEILRFAQDDARLHSFILLCGHPDSVRAISSFEMLFDVCVNVARKELC